MLFCSLTLTNCMYTMLLGLCINSPMKLILGDGKLKQNVAVVTG